MHDTTHHEASFWRRLLHRWFVEYNPLYLLSATLVLGGMFLLSRGLAHEGNDYGEVGIAAIAEVYALALIGGAALLTRIGHRRPAVMLALLTVLYQWDLTLHTETCVNLGALGAWATGGWLVLFVIKLRALAWAMRLRLSRAAIGGAMTGALGLAVLPQLLSRVEPRLGSALVALWMCVLASSYRVDAVSSLVELDAWGKTVARRSVRATWLLSMLLLALHVLFWASNRSLELALLAVIVPVLATHWLEREIHVWTVVVATLSFTAVAAPSGFSVAAFVAAVTLGRRALEARASFSRAVVAGAPRPTPPYRAFGGPGAPPTTAGVEYVAVDGRAAAGRFGIGAVGALYLAGWTIGWSGGEWPVHMLELDILFTGLALIGAWRFRLRSALAPVVAAWSHLVVQARLIPSPHSLLEWGAASVGLGFVLLVASLAVSYRLRNPPAS